MDSYANPPVAFGSPVRPDLKDQEKLRHMGWAMVLFNLSWEGVNQFGYYVTMLALHEKNLAPQKINQP